jgi:hypothetical protein
MRVAIIQPHFLPFIGYFDLMNRADLFIYYDTVQFVRRSWHCRTYITEQGTARWLSVPVRTAEGSRRPLCEVQWADDQPWRTKMVRRLKHCYSDSEEPYLLKEILGLIQIGPASLTDWNIQANDLLAAALNIRTTSLKVSDLHPATGDKQQRIIHLCRELGATRYLCGPGSKSYVRDNDFAEFGIKIEWLDYDYEHWAITPHGTRIFPSIVDYVLRRGLTSAFSSFTDVR